MWFELRNEEDVSRAAAIMRLMHEHYWAMDTKALNRWLTKPREGGRTAELFGWFPGDDQSPAGLFLVLGVTSQIAAQGGRHAVFAEYFGVAADTIEDPDVGDDQVREWHTVFFQKVHELTLAEGVFKAVRPKSMKFKPMQRLHDLVTMNTEVIDRADSNLSRYRVVIDEERDRGSALFWMLRIVPAAEADAPTQSLPDRRRISR